MQITFGIMSKFISGLIATLIGLIVIVIFQYLFISMEDGTRTKIAAFVGIITIRFAYKKLRNKPEEEKSK